MGSQPDCRQAASDAATNDHHIHLVRHKQQCMGSPSACTPNPTTDASCRACVR
jgi:hypothetical protein